MTPPDASTTMSALDLDAEAHGKNPMSAPDERERSIRRRSEVRARSQAVLVRMTPEERDRFTALAERKGWSLPQLMRLGVEAALLAEQAHGRDAR